MELTLQPKANSEEIYEYVEIKFGTHNDAGAPQSQEQRLAAIDKEIAHAKEEIIAHQMLLTSLQHYRHEVKFPI